MSCVVCSNESPAEIKRTHLMFDNLRNILNTDFYSITISLKPIEGYNFFEDYIDCPFCFQRLTEIKTFYYLLEEK